MFDLLFNGFIMYQGLYFLLSGYFKFKRSSSFFNNFINLLNLNISQRLRFLSIVFVYIELITGMLMIVPATRFYGVIISIPLFITMTIIVFISLRLNKERFSCGCLGNFLNTKTSYKKV